MKNARLVVGIAPSPVCGMYHIPILVASSVPIFLKLILIGKGLKIMRKFELSKQAILLILLTVIQAPSPSWGQDQPRVGREAAAKYFQKSSPSENPGYGARGDHYMSFHVGRMMSNQSYEWGGSGKKENVGKDSVGFTYRFSEWHLSDLGVRVDYNTYEVNNTLLSKLSIMPIITFPEAASMFPIYFGVGGGIGVFFKQLEGESALSLDYQLVAGARFLNVFENTGFFLESGLKNHIQLLSSGQLNGTYLTTGAVFTF